MSEVLKEQDSVCGIPCSKLSFDNIKIVKTNYLIKCFSKLPEDDPTSDPLRSAHIVLMMKTLNLTASVDFQQEMNILEMLKELLSSLRSTATIFCLDTTPSTELFEKALSCFSGQMLYGPIQHTYKTPVIHSEPSENLPPAETSSTFFMWCKSARSINCASPQTSFESARSEENSMIRKPTISEGSGSSKDCAGDDVKVKYSEILPWRELPPGKVSWGKIFWETMSQTPKKSLKSLMSLNKEVTEHHWIGETIRLYLRERESQDCSSLTNYSGDNILMSEDVEVEDDKIVLNNQTEISLTSSQIFNSEDIGDANGKKIFIDNAKLFPETESFIKQCTNYENLSIIQNDNISDKITCTSVENSLVEKVNLFISKDSEDLTEVSVTETELYPEIHTVDENISIEKEIEINSNTSSLSVDNVNSFCLSKDASQETNLSQNITEATDNITQETTMSSKVHSKTSVPQNICLNKDEVVQETIKETLSQVITDNISIALANKINFGTQSVPLSGSSKKKSVKPKADVTVCQESVTCKPNSLRSCPKPDKKYSEILPWKELPPGKIPWGEIFWQNSSLKMKKSLKCVFSYKKDILDRHWIGDVARLYIEEFGEPDLSTLSKKIRYREQSIKNNKTEECPQDFNKTSGFLFSIPQPVLTSMQVNTSKSKLDTNAKNELLKIGDPWDIALTDNCNSKSIQNNFVDEATESLNKVKTILPLKTKENQNDLFNMNKPKKVTKTWSDLLREHNETNNPTSAVCIHNKNDKSVETKSTQTDFSEIAPAKNNLPLIKALTESVEQLKTSLEKSAGINSFNKHHIHAHQTTNKTSHCDHGASQSPTNSGLGITSPTSAPRNTFLFEKKCSLPCCFQSCMVQHCRCNNQPLGHYCSINCHSQCCNVAGCGLSLQNQFKCSSDQSYVHLTSENLVIPIQGVSDNALLKIMSLLKNS
ncbi:hypothetical protein JTE90_026893 [Oedothorax gibbosus]|uniref:Tesmin/TSO1-like CXC domain-containing protein n=1 Tax=Oedothorax gibbosus TaxID=931172 RepID=A0AAV6UCG3_9ARAC|nr:hypothetical protein JTE90_026893 [Oedothorax gibbosus]